MRTTVQPSWPGGDRLLFVNPELRAAFGEWTAPYGIELPSVRETLQLRFNMTLYESMRASFVSRSRELVQR